MRVAVDARMAGMSGIGRYLRCLVQAVSALPEEGIRLTLFLNPGQDAAWVPASPRLEVRRLSREVPVYSWRELWTSWEGYDLLHVPHFNIPWNPPKNLVVTLHDAVYWRFPLATGSHLGGFYARTMLARSVRKAARIIAVSRATADDAVHLLKADPSRIEVVHHGAPAFLGHPEPEKVASLKNTWKAPDGYVLYVGNFLTHKGLDVLLTAMGTLKVQGRDLPLVLVGKDDRRAEPLRRAGLHLGLDGRVVFAGHLDDAWLAAAYAGARVVACPSPWEGFGFPMLEGFAAGVPVVGVDSGAAPEVAAGAALLAARGDAVGLAEAILRVWSDAPLREKLAAAGRERLKVFSWEEAARKTVGVYRQVVGLRHADQL